MLRDDRPRVIFSSRQRQTGTRLNKRGKICVVCHGKELLFAASSQNRSRRFHEATGEEFLDITNPIYNEVSCYTASRHFQPAAMKVLDVVVSLDKMHSLLYA